ncbi:MAG: purine-nucleoside phosphorylase [Treponema sp.]|jgi:purine-nucleoside phosphorylase|nr:purine-nucleoside phosphorylase [Treponema sp.]
MSIHIAAKEGEIAEVVLLPGDPLRAQYVADTFLSKVTQYNTIRNMFGYTGLFRGKPISVQGTGMGIPSLSIYVNELFRDYNVQRALRVGTAGSLQESVRLRDLVLAMSACTDSGANSLRFGGRSYAPTASFTVLKAAYNAARERDLGPRVGSVVSSDMFYSEDPDEWKLWASYGCLAVEMECAELYTLAAKYKREALCLLTISDSFITGETTSAEERQTSFKTMMEIALETALAV